MTQSPIQKTCARCKKTKSVTKYWRSSRTRDGFDYYCRDCRKIAHNETRARHKVSRREKERDAARKRPSPPVTPEQREQHNARMRQHYREHRDRYRARDAVKQAVLRGERLIRGALSMGLLHSANCLSMLWSSPFKITFALAPLPGIPAAVYLRRDFPLLSVSPLHA